MQQRKQTPRLSTWCYIISVATSSFRLRRVDALLTELLQSCRLTEAEGVSNAHLARFRAVLNHVARACVRVPTLIAR